MHAFKKINLNNPCLVIVITKIYLDNRYELYCSPYFMLILDLPLHKLSDGLVSYWSTFLTPIIKWIQPFHAFCWLHQSRYLSRANSNKWFHSVEMSKDVSMHLHLKLPNQLKQNCSRTAIYFNYLYGHNLSSWI